MSRELEVRAGETGPPTELGRLRRWIVEHDDRWLFVVLYVGLAVVLSIWISLFWLVAVVASHFALEWVRQRHFDPEPLGALARVMWELKLDLGLVLFALALAAYMEVVLGVVGLGAAARVGLQSGARFAAWQRVLRGVLLTVDDAAQVVRVVARGGSPRGEGAEAGPAAGAITAGLRASATRWGGWSSRWTFGDHFAIWFGVVCGLLVVLAPALSHHDLASLIALLFEELHPFPGSGVDGR
jgi:hypothetical protein